MSDYDIEDEPAEKAIHDALWNLEAATDAYLDWRRNHPGWKHPG